MANWTDEMIQNVWEKGKVVSNNDSSKWRKDECGAWIARNKHGDRDSQYGWEIDHISTGGKDILSNLRPLQWGNNVDKSDGRLKCNITSDGTRNVNSRK
jgi:hypothetical protein